MFPELIPNFSTHLPKPHREDWIAAVGFEIDRALWPWKSGGAETYIRREMGKNDELWIELRTFPELRFVYSIYPFEVLGYPDELAYKIAKAAFTFFRNRPALPVEDHIILGEN